MSFVGEEREGEQESAERIITKIEVQKKNKRRYNIFLNDEFAFAVHEDIMIKHRLFKGDVVTNEWLEELLQDEERNDAYLKALRFLGVRPRTEKEMRLKLKESGYEEVLIEETIRRLVDQKYLDDRLFAKMWAEQRVGSQHKGKALIRQELILKGVPRDDIQNVLQAIDPEEELASAVDIGVKKWRQTSGENFERKRKTAAFLLRRGYSNEVVQQVLRRISTLNDNNY
ncbi:RecX family transcriptional regulator [Paenibacillus chartarius]|uniref:Regulatory protein RecX n=1 Tax=Paenibacillus chartarius TaxID=747481 RepID=A0ABV6DSP4_9BACL